MLQKIVTVVVVDDIEPALATWQGLGFARVAEVQHEGRLGFVILAGDGLELMMQTRASCRADLGFVPDGLVLYVDVSSLDDAVAAAVGVEVLIARRVTPYGATETVVRDLAGTVVIFAVH